LKFKSTKQVHAYKLELTKIDGAGDFLCPHCGNKISPDDEKEEAYSIVEAKVNSCGLEELIICCKRCTSEIHLTGFSLLQKIESKEKSCLGPLSIKGA
jgi:hypothetical protein